MLDGEHDIFKMGGLRRRFPAHVLGLRVRGADPGRRAAADPHIQQQGSHSQPGLLSGTRRRHALDRWMVVGRSSRRCTPSAWCSWCSSVPSGPSRTGTLALDGRAVCRVGLLGAIAGFPELLSASSGVKGFYHFLQSAMPGPVRDFASAGDVWLFQVDLRGQRLWRNRAGLPALRSCARSMSRSIGLYARRIAAAPVVVRRLGLRLAVSEAVRRTLHRAGPAQS